MKSNVSVFLTAAAFCLAAWSCSGENSTSLPPAPEIPEQPIDPDALCTITPRSVAIAPVDASQTPLTRSATGEPVQEVTYAENLAHNSSLEATLEAMPQEAQTRASVSLETGVQYGVFAIDNTGQIVGEATYAVGSSTPVSGSLQLKIGTYRLFCYSINEKGTLSTSWLDGKTIMVNFGDDFMTYTVPNFTVTAADYLNGKTLDIQFVRQCAKLIVTVKSQEYRHGDITGAQTQLKSSIYSHGLWSTSNSDQQSTLTIIPKEVVMDIEQSSGTGSSVDCGYNKGSYTCVAPFTGQSLTFQNIVATIDGVEKKLAGTIPLTNVTMTKGQSYRLTIIFSNYYVLTDTNPVVINGQKWARTNLQQADNSTNVFFATNPWDSTKRWSWGMRKPETLSSTLKDTEDWVGTSGENQDPCRALGGKWRLPTKTECEFLQKSKAPNETKVKINGVIKTVDYNNGGILGGGSIFIDNARKILLYVHPAIGNQFVSYWTSTHLGTLDAYYTANSVDVNRVESERRYFMHALRCITD